MLLRRALLLALAASSALGGCVSPDNAAKVETALGKKCTLDSDCSAPNVCVFELCHAECATDADCEGGGRCVKGEGASASVCQLLTEVSCSKDVDCPGQQICAKDGECRDACSDAMDCVSPQTCVAGACASADELVDGGLPATGGEGKECHWNSDCPGTLLCVGGVCGPECKADKDCAPGTSCLDGTCGVPPSCGDGVKQAGEACDGADVGGATCPGGLPIGCNADCTLDLAGCPCTSAADCAALNDACNVGACVGGDCVQQPANQGGPCEDGDPCTSGDACALGACLGGGPTDCKGLDGYCTVGTCDPALGCVAAPANEGGFCDDGLLCTGAESCQSGQCVGSPVACPSGNACQAPVCDEAAGGCGLTPANEGGACDDGSACTLNDACAGGACTGTPIVVCQTGDGCCPAGCTFPQDEDCSGTVYLTSSNGSPGFYGYSASLDAWSVLPDPPTPTFSQLTTDGTLVYLMGADDVVYAYDPDAAQWSAVQPGPGALSAQPIGFFKWTTSGFFYVKDGDTALWHSAGGGAWVSYPLPEPASSAGSWDEATNALYIRGMGNQDLMIFDVPALSVSALFPGAGTCGENSRTGTYHAGYFYTRDWDFELNRMDVATGAITGTGIVPTEGHTSSDVDPYRGHLYIGPYSPTGTEFQRYDIPNGTLTTLAPLPVSVWNHSTIVYVQASSPLP